MRMHKTRLPDAAARNRQTCRLHCAVVAGILFLSGCRGIQSTLDPQGPQADEIARIAWVMFWGAGFILLLVMALALATLFRTPSQRRPVSANVFIIAGGVALPVITLTALLIYGVDAMRSLRATAEPTAQIEVVGNRWWWDVHYRDPDGHAITSANEIRIPAGKPVKVLVRTNDVIHSFWVPNLAGKIDLIPGRSNHIVLHANAPGQFRGQCAEFCGAQHARMAFHVIAQAPEAHAAWLAQQRMPATAPADRLSLRGQEVFLARCAQCHTVRGVSEGAKRAPDLTHLASRQFIAAGTLENNRQNLIAFVSRSQEIKPGSDMPSHSDLDDATLQALASYLESLK